MDWRPLYDEGRDAAIGSVGRGLEGEGGACRLKTGVCAEEDVMGSEETPMAGELWPLDMITIEMMGEADGLFYIGRWWTADGTSSVSRRSRGPPPSVPADEGEGGFCRSNGVLSAGNVLACGIRGVVGDGDGDGERDDGGGGNAALGVVELPSISSPETTLLVMLPALEGRSRGVKFPFASRDFLYCTFN